MTYEGTIRNGVVVFDNGIQLPDGTPVRVVPLSVRPTGEAEAGADDPVFQMSQLAVDTGIPDLAANIDYYLYGHPKQADGK
jgi:hypothetical protein